MRALIRTIDLCMLWLCFVTVYYNDCTLNRKGGIVANAFRLPANAANTSVQMLGKKLLALWEGGPPYEVHGA
jgi:carotenoid cleavage dioxygenase-like enzyme